MKGGVMLLRGETGYNTTALIELVQVQGAHGKNSPPAKTNGTSKAITSQVARKRKSRTSLNFTFILNTLYLASLLFT